LSPNELGSGDEHAMQTIIKNKKKSLVSILFNFSACLAEHAARFYDGECQKMEKEGGRSRSGDISNPASNSCDYSIFEKPNSFYTALQEMIDEAKLEVDTTWLCCTSYEGFECIDHYTLDSVCRQYAENSGKSFVVALCSQVISYLIGMTPKSYVSDPHIPSNLKFMQIFGSLRELYDDPSSAGWVTRYPQLKSSFETLSTFIGNNPEGDIPCYDMGRMRDYITETHLPAETIEFLLSRIGRFSPFIYYKCGSAGWMEALSPEVLQFLENINHVNEGLPELQKLNIQSIGAGTGFLEGALPVKTISYEMPSRWTLDPAKNFSRLEMLKNDFSGTSAENLKVYKQNYKKMINCGLNLSSLILYAFPVHEMEGFVKFLATKKVKGFIFMSHEDESPFGENFLNDPTLPAFLEENKVSVQPTPSFFNMQTVSYFFCPHLCQEIK